VTRLRCPHCQNPITFADEKSDEVLCPGCGSSFCVREARATVSATPMKPLGKVREENEANLRPVLQPVRGLALTACDVETQIRHLTLEQYRALDQAALNEQIILVGAAGTGKTVLPV
jgi:phosphate starvation-inducible protein PhoH